MAKDNGRCKVWRQPQDNRDARNIDTELRRASNIQLILQRQLGLCARRRYQTQVLDGIFNKFLTDLREREFSCSPWDKAFACAWINANTVVIGTKCNKLICLHVNSGACCEIPLPARPSCPFVPPSTNTCSGAGIHTIAVNPAGTLLATGGSNPSDCTVYRLPSLEPLQTLVGHRDWIFGASWMSEEHVVTGSRDGTMKLWRVRDEAEHTVNLQPYPGYPHTEKVRDVKFCRDTVRLASLSTDGLVRFWRVCNAGLEVERTEKMMFNREAVCLGVNANCVAVGSCGYVTLLDARQPSCVTALRSPDTNQGTRSVHFNEQLLAFGTGSGKVFFYDMRNQQLLPSKASASTEPLSLQIGKGWLDHNDTYRQYYHGLTVPNACYSLAWDDSNTRLLTCGGPLAFGLKGCYIGLWS